VGRPWTSAETDLLVQAYKIGRTHVEIGAQLGRSASVVAQKTLQLGLRPERWAQKGWHRWTSQEIDLLRKLLAEGCDLETIAQKLGHSYFAVTRKARLLGLHVICREIWSSEKDSVLREGVAAKQSCVALAKLLGVSPHVIEERLKKLGLTRKTRLQARNIEICRLVENGLSVSQIAHKFGVHINTVYRTWWSSGRRKRTRTSSEWPPHDLDTLRTAIAQGKSCAAIAREGARTPCMVRRKAKQLGLITHRPHAIGRLQAHELAQRGLRHCTICHQVKPVDVFHRGVCNMCNAALERKRVGSSPQALLRTKWNAARSRAARKKVPFTITYEDVCELWDHQQGRCHYTQKEMTSTRNQGHTVSLDRIVPSAGYVPGNVVLCCSTVNTMKHIHTTEEFYEWCRAVIEHAPRCSKM
jgi:transposase-like protein